MGTKDPKFYRLNREVLIRRYQPAAPRRSLWITLSALMFVIYFGFILLVAFAPGFSGRR
jgi:uncharacterized membrane protein (DUF485 family)